MGHRSVVVAATAVGLMLAGCTAASPGPSANPSPPSTSPSFRPTASSPQAAADLLRDAWRHDDREAATRVAPDDIVDALFRVGPQGWGAPRFSGGVFRLHKRGIPGAMQWRVQNLGTGWFVSVVDVPPIPLPVDHLRGPAWGLYVAAGGSGYSQLAAATVQLQDVGLSTRFIATWPASCQALVADRLDIPAGFYTVALYFERKAEAKAFEDDLGFPPLGVLRVGKLDC